MRIKVITRDGTERSSTLIVDEHVHKDLAALSAMLTDTEFVNPRYLGIFSPGNTQFNRGDVTIVAYIQIVFVKDRTADEIAEAIIGNVHAVEQAFEIASTTSCEFVLERGAYGLQTYITKTRQ
jgi:hypothetical protein